MYFKTEFNETSKIWSGPTTLPLHHPNITVAQVVLDTAERDAAKICQISADDDYQMTFGEMRTHIIRMALNLKNNNMQMGDLICIVAKNGRYVASVAYGSLLIGLTVSTMDPFFNTSEMVHALGLSKPKLIFCDEDNLVTVKAALQLSTFEALIYVFPEKTVGASGARSVFELLQANPGEQDFIIPNLGDISRIPALILCSSGTTGLPKGVCLSHPAVLSQLYKRWKIQADDVLLSFSSLYWMSGWIMLLAGMLNGVTRLITKDQYSPDLMLKLIAKYRVTSIFSAPHQMMLVTQSPNVGSYNLDSVRLIQIGGSLVSEGLKESLLKYLKNGSVVVGYGATEIGGFISSTYYKDRHRSVGQLTVGIQIKIINEDGCRLGVNEVGEVCGKSVYPFLGYKNNEKATREAIDKDGWILTGDLGYFDEDGFLFLVDRIKDIIKYQNHQISPSEIEVVIQQLPEVLSVSVVGIPDPVSTDLPAAVIVRKSETLTEKMVIDYVAQNVSNQKQLRGGVYFIDKLPLTYSGKVMRREVRKIAVDLYGERNRQ